MSKLTPEQYDFLLGQIAEGRVRQLRGNSHLEAWDVRRNLIRGFGFGGFDIETKSLDLVAQIEHPPTQPNGKPRWTVVYRAEIRLIVKAADGSILQVLEDGAAGDSQNQPSLGDAHDQAMKTALSQGLKRCAVNLGDQFGLSLYNGGGTQRVVVRSLVHPELPEAPAAPALPTDDAPVLPEPGTEPAADVDQVAEQTRPVSAPPADRPVSAPPAAASEMDAAKALRDWVLKPGRTTSEILTARTKLLSEHPERAAQRITNDVGEEEQLAVFMTRISRELAPGTAEETAPAPAPAKPSPGEERRRKRMHALFNELGYSGEANRPQRLQVIARVAKRDVTSSNELTAGEVEDVIATLEVRKRQLARTGVAA